MKLQAKARLRLKAANTRSVTDFFERMGRIAAGKELVSKANHDCRVTVIRYLNRKFEADIAKFRIVIVGLRDPGDKVGHAIHTFLTDQHHKILADAYEGGQWDGETYTCGLGDEKTHLVELASLTVEDFVKRYVIPLQHPLKAILSSTQAETHGHVVPRADGLRAKCGGPPRPGRQSPIQCRVCAREAQLLAAGQHPLTSKTLSKETK